ncbi:kinase-like domain-containing protein [Mycena crocata]|nr:kinase-like domain-containing protein [Mycena crocata]
MDFLDGLPLPPNTMDNEEVPQTQEQQGAPRPAVTRPHPDLWGYLERYPGSHLVPQARYDLRRDQPEVTIGRTPGNTIVLNYPTSSVHARLRWTGVKNGVSQVILEDNRSSNKTYVHGSQVNPKFPRTLKDEAEISFTSSQPPPPGDTTLQDFRFIYHDLASPKRGLLEDYHISDKYLGEGTFAQVYMAYDRDGVAVAVKMIQADKSLKYNYMYNSREETMTEHELRVQREIELMKVLEHPNICRLREHFWNDDGTVDLVLEYMEGGDLHDFINKSDNGLSERMTKHLLRQLCEALAFIHERNISHLDLKPENVLLTLDRPPILKIADFGLAKLIDPEIRIKSRCGTVDFVAPEFVINMLYDKGYNTRPMDVYACGGIGFCCVVSRMYGPIHLGMPKHRAYSFRDLTPERLIDWPSLDQHVLERDKEGYPVYFSTEGRHFIRRLMEWDPRKRMTMPEALQHKWLEFNQADAYTAPPTDAYDELSQSLQDVSMDLTPTSSKQNAALTLRAQATEPDIAPGLSLLKNKDRQLQRRSVVLERARQSQQLYVPSDEQLQSALPSKQLETCIEPQAGPSGVYKRKHSTLTPSPVGDSDTIQKTPIRGTSPSPAPSKKGKGVDPDEMCVTSAAEQNKRLVRRVGR